MTALIIAIGVIASVCIAAGLLGLRDTVRRWIAWARVRGDQRRAAGERRVMQIDNGGKRRR